MNPRRERIMLELFTRMADYMDSNGMAMDAALAAAAEDMTRALHEAITQATADSFREAGIKKH